MEFKEVKRKNGGTLVFCDFEELLETHYGTHTMADVETHATSGGEYIIHCPFCKKEGHTKYKLYIKTDLTVGHCFVCCRDFVHLSKDGMEAPKILLPTLRGFDPQTIPSDHLELVRLQDPKWTLDRFTYEFDDFDQRGYDYLVGRHPFMSELYKILGFKFLDGNVVMPFKYHDEIFYYQIRFIDGPVRYFFPPISAKPPYIIEHGDNRKIIICEGVYDAIACLIMAPEYTPVAVLGSSISDYQLEFIREYLPQNIIVYMDKTEISQRIASKVKSVIDYCPIHLIKSDGEDPEECMKRRLSTGKPLKWITDDLFKKYSKLW